jgi:hypothetical protein
MVNIIKLPVKIYKRSTIEFYFCILESNIENVSILGTYENATITKYIIKTVLFNAWNYKEVTDKKILTKLKLKGLVWKK